MSKATGTYKDTLRQVRLLLAANALICLVVAGFVLRTWSTNASDVSLWLALLILLLITVANIAYLKKYLEKSRRLELMEEEAARMDTCFKEVHHRVKNNLQTVSSLLNLQHRSTDDPSAGKLIKSSQHRVKSMAMVHEMLYHNDRYTSRLPAEAYFRDLAQYLLRSFKGEDSARVELQLNTQGIHLNADTLIPLGILVNEVITNSLKYAFTDKESGLICIELSSPEQGCYRLFMSDNGIGLGNETLESADEGAAVRLSPSTSLGLRLIDKITRQLKGDLRRGSDENGTWYELDFEESIQGHEL